MSCMICNNQRAVKKLSCYICNEYINVCVNHKKYNVCQKHFIEQHTTICSYNYCDGICEAMMGYDEPCEMRYCKECLRWFLLCKDHINMKNTEVCSECFYE